jgi:hypothetical protein
MERPPTCQGHLCSVGLWCAVVHGKGREGKRVVWIGTEFELFPDKVLLGTPRKMVEEICEMLETWSGKGMISTRELRMFLGKLAGVAAIVPRLRWTVTALYAILTKVQQDEQLEHERALRRQKDKRAKIGLVAVMSILGQLQMLFPDKTVCRAVVCRGRERTMAPPPQC